MYHAEIMSGIVCYSFKKKEVNGYFVQTKKDCTLTKVGKICYMRKNENNTWMYNWLSFSFFSLKRP